MLCEVEVWFVATISSPLSITQGVETYLFHSNSSAEVLCSPTIWGMKKFKYIVYIFYITVDPHCSRILYLRICLLTWISLQPWNQYTQGVFMVIVRHAQSEKNFESPKLLSFQQRPNKVMSPYFSSYTVSKWGFLWSNLMACFSHFCWWFHCWRESPGIVIKYCLVSLSIGRLWCTRWRKYVC